MSMRCSSCWINILSLTPLLYREPSAFLLWLYSCSIFDSYRHTMDFGETLNMLGLIFFVRFRDLSPYSERGGFCSREVCIHMGSLSVGGRILQLLHSLRFLSLSYKIPLHIWEPGRKTAGTGRASVLQHRGCSKEHSSQSLFSRVSFGWKEKSYRSFFLSLIKRYWGWSRNVLMFELM